ncbi:helix-hairpin-helix domain-containing protein [Flagellimonas meishanensis]|uniref:helix-hairpin-helix domain-containing protein n=1 Tax=Flagellimonas meishanensis TaxID=2873264 RepID=UPI00223C4AC8|nr:helix-hairpin-helix domain-containing protein [[Muricauda] meishanensis]
MKSHFKFNKQERSGIFFLLFIIVVLQGVYYYVKTQPNQKESNLVLNTFEQAKLDSLKNNVQKDTTKIFPFNANYLTDYRGYVLGMSTEQIDRLLAYRKQNNYVNSVEEFQRITQVPDSTLSKLRPYLKFPQWTDPQRSWQKGKSSLSKAIVVDKKDLNKVSAEELTTINGIGEVLSQRIVKFRDRLGGFIVNEQLYDVYGLEPEVVQRVLHHFDVMETPTVEKININKASEGQLSRLVYINKELARQIIVTRDSKGGFISLDELGQVPNFPTDRIERIKLYLQL